jgi:hypothetical protein
MVQWYDSGLLPEDLAVRFSSNMGFIPIKEMFPAIPPFRSKPLPRPVEIFPKQPAATGLQAGHGSSPQANVCNCQWVYQDTKGNVQGPFLSNQMLLWYEHKMLPKDLKLRRTNDSAYSLISEYFPRPLLPFQSQPVNPVQMRGQTVSAPLPSTHGAQIAKVAQPSPAPAATAVPPATPVLAQVAAQQPVQPKNAATKGKNKGGKAGKPAAGQEEADTEDGKDGGVGKDAGANDGKGGKGANGGPIGAAKSKKAQQQANQWWSDPQWASSDKAWWEWASWNGWSGEGGEWEAENNYGRGKAQGVEWKQGQGGDAGPVGANPNKESKSDRNAAAQQQANGFGLKWGPKAEPAELFPEANLKRVLDEGIVWEERWVSPLAVRFSQGKIHPFFHERGPISEVLLQISAKADENGAIKRIEPPFPPMRLLHLKPFGVLVTLDNRRLYALQRFALQEWPTVCLVKALCVEELTPTRLKAENRKFTNCIGGLQIEIESRSNAFDTFSWVTEAGRMEHTRFCRPISFKAVDKALSLMPVFVVHLLLSAKMRPMLRSRWPLLQYLAANLKVSQRRQFPAKRLMLLHVLELAKSCSRAKIWPDVCIGFKLETVVKLSKGKSCLTSNHTVTRPLKLLEAPTLISPVQLKILHMVLPFFCLPYARTVLRGSTQDWVVAFLLAWGKVSCFSMMEVPEP